MVVPAEDTGRAAERKHTVEERATCFQRFTLKTPQELRLS